MSNSAYPINEYLEVARCFQRSVNLEKDYRGSLHNGEYIVTPTALESLHRLAEGLADASPSRAWTITGPYGVGKSAFAVFLTRLLCSADRSGYLAREQLRKAAPDLAAKLDDLEICRNGAKGYLPILITARRAPAPTCIAEGVVEALKSDESHKLKQMAWKLNASFDLATNGAPLDTRRVVSAIETVSSAARDEGYKGIFFVIDELGKLFEYAARYPRKGDVYVLQELAEHVSRSNEFPAILIGLLHQSFEEYGHLLDMGTRREWSKIQGRFGDIAFLEPVDQVIRMVAEAIRWKVDRQRGLEAKVEQVVNAAAEVGAAPPGMPLDEFKRTAIDAYPLHPLTLVVLPYIFQRFGQNERSLFSYLSSMEPYGFQEFVKTRSMIAETPEFIRIGDLFDYFIGNFGLGLYRQPQALRWLEAADVLERKDDLGTSHREVVKVVGVLNVLGQFSHLSASAEMISLAVMDSVSPDGPLRSILKELGDASILTYRRYKKSYQIWEGSDVDIEKRIAEGERKTQQNRSIADSVRHYMASRPMVARRHSFETGMLRLFDVVYVDSLESLEQVIKAKTEVGGKVIVCLAESTSLAEQFQEFAEKTSILANVLLAIPQQLGMLRGVMSELGALRWVWDNTPELRDDRVARREVSLRITEAEQLLLRNLNGLVDPRPEPVGSGCLWFYAGDQQQVTKPSDISQLLSNVFDRVFNKSPRIRNELIVRRTLSSAAAAARRNLIEAMLQKSDQPALGIERFPPERSIYESVLRATGLHAEQEDGSWALVEPSQDSEHNLFPCWKHLSDLIFKRQPEPVPLNELFCALAAPPYGILDGLHPILLCAFMLVYPNETTLYREGTFLPEPDINDFEVMLRRPELFSLAGCKVTGDRAAVVQRLARGLKVETATVPVVRALFRMTKAFPEFAWNTRKLSTETLGLRDAFLAARSPERFLFVAVPEALGFPAFSMGEPTQSEIETFFSALNQSLQEWSAATPQAIDDARDILLEACNLPSGDAGWNLLRQEAMRLERSVVEPQLLAFVRRVIQANVDRSGVESVCALVVSRLPATWADSDAERFPDAARIVGKLFREAIATSNVSTIAVAASNLLSKTDRESAEHLKRELRTILDKKQTPTSVHIIKSVLIELIREYDGTAAR